jgi:hypothetical protein
MDELFEAERKNLTQEPLNPIKASSLTLTFEKGKTFLLQQSEKLKSVLCIKYLSIWKIDLHFHFEIDSNYYSC